MTNEVRYLNLGQVSPEIYMALWEYDNCIALKEPLLIKFTQDRTLVEFWQGPCWDDKVKEWYMPFSDLSQYFNSPELSDIFMCRPYVKLELPYDADMSYYVMSKYVTNFIMFYPGIGRIKEDKDKRSEISEIFFDSTQKVLKNKYDIETKIPRNINNSPSNDVFFKDDDKWRKFLGAMYRPASNNYGFIDMSITYKFDSGIADRIRKFDSEIKVKKFDVEDIRDRVGGLWEINSTIERNKFESEIVNNICKFLNLSIKEEQLTSEEEQKLFERGKRRLTEKEWYLYGNNENFEIRY